MRNNDADKINIVAFDAVAGSWCSINNIKFFSLEKSQVSDRPLNKEVLNSFNGENALKEYLANDNIVTIPGIVACLESFSEYEQLNTEELQKIRTLLKKSSDKVNNTLLKRGVF